MRRLGAVGGMPPDRLAPDLVPLDQAPPDVLPPGVSPGSEAARRRLASCRDGRAQPVQTVKVAPPGEIVTTGHGVLVPGPHRTNWLTLTVSVATGSARVSVPASGDTVTASSGSLATETDHRTAPPVACSEISGPVRPGTTIIVPPSGSTDSVPGTTLGGGGGGWGEIVLVGGSGVGLGLGG